nr:energy transducer TonB [uncultured Sphingomonas sp.]
MTAGAIIALALQAATPAAHVDRSAAKWGVEYAPNQCIINRAFGDGPKPAILAIDVDPQSDRGDIVLLMPEKAWRGTSGTAAVTLTPGVAKFPARWVGGATGHDMYAIKLSLADDQWKAVPTAETLLVDAGADRPIDVPIKGIGKAFAAAKTCGRDLLQSWGADPDAMIDLEPAVAARLFTADDYPVDALRGDQQGLVKTLVTVDAQGKPTACRVVVSYKIASLDDTSCRVLMTRGTFPSSDKQVRYHYHRTRWVIPAY